MTAFAALSLSINCTHPSLSYPSSLALPLYFLEESICLAKHLKAIETDGAELTFSHAVCL